MAHESRLNLALRELFQTTRAAALGTLHADETPFVSMVPFALHSASVVIHVSGLAPHTRNLLSSPAVSLLIMQEATPDQGVHALPRVTLQGLARPVAADDLAHLQIREAYLARFPEAEPMTTFGDFSFIAIGINSAHHVAGFGAARSLGAQEIAHVMRGSS